MDDGQGIQSVMGNFFCCDRTFNFGRISKNQGVVGYHCVLGDQGSGGDNTVVSDDGVVHDNCPHADKRVVSNGTTMDRGVVPDGDMISNGDIGAFIYMYDTAVLNVRAKADGYGSGFGTKDSVEPNIRMLHQGDISTDDRSGSNIDIICKDGMF